MLVTRPLKLGAGRVFELDALPRIGLELLHAERDALGLRVEADDLHLDGLADMQRLGGMVDAPPGDVGDVQQAVDAAEIDEGAVIGDVLDDAVEDLALLEAGDQLGARSARLSSSTARRDTTMLPRERSILRIWKGCGVPSSGVMSRTGRISTWLPGRNATAPLRSTVKPPLTRPKIMPVTRSLRLEALLELGPGLLAPRLLARQLRLAVLVLHALEEDLDDVADLDLGAAGRRSANSLSGDAAFGFEADIDQRACRSRSAITVPLTTVPSRPLATPSDSSSSAAKLSLPGRVRRFRLRRPLPSPRSRL